MFMISYVYFLKYYIIIIYTNFFRAVDFCCVTKCRAVVFVE